MRSMVHGMDLKRCSPSVCWCQGNPASQAFSMTPILLFVQTHVPRSDRGGTANFVVAEHVRLALLALRGCIKHRQHHLTRQRHVHHRRQHHHSSQLCAIVTRDTFLWRPCSANQSQSGIQSSQNANPSVMLPAMIGACSNLYVYVNNAGASCAPFANRFRYLRLREGHRSRHPCPLRRHPHFHHCCRHFCPLHLHRCRLSPLPQHHRIIHHLLPCHRHPPNRLLTPLSTHLHRRHRHRLHPPPWSVRMKPAPAGALGYASNAASPTSRVQHVRNVSCKSATQRRYISTK
mmetsp:Transcript_67235/g.111789  ORF Transcript_67235/g.111789 Transcript_67235/m.111789 type:complete len:289 (+) Transcript_67235:71-937(+)